MRRNSIKIISQQNFYLAIEKLAFSVFFLSTDDILKFCFCYYDKLNFPIFRFYFFVGNIYGLSEKENSAHGDCQSRGSRSMIPIYPHMSQFDICLGSIISLKFEGGDNMWHK